MTVKLLGYGLVSLAISHLHSSGIVPLSSIHFKRGDDSLVRFWKATWLGDNDDNFCIWSLSHEGGFSVRNIRKHIDDCMLPNLIPCTRWYKVLPRKVNIFMWRLFMDRLSHRFNLSSRGLDIASILCIVCNGHVESNIHVFFSCDTDSIVWRLVRAWSDSKIPILSSCEDLDSWLLSWHASKDSKDRPYFIFATTC
ncbi:RNA-directed DNA polymerase, eukaryota [Tanacetum coccineum]